MTFPTQLENESIALEMGEVVIEAESATCVLCDATVSGDTEIYDLHQSQTSSTETTLSCFLGKTLGISVLEQTLHSSVICWKCFMLINELDGTQEKCKALKKQITTLFEQISSKYGYLCSTLHEVEKLSVGCQTDKGNHGVSCMDSSRKAIGKLGVVSLTSPQMKNAEDQEAVEEKVELFVKDEEETECKLDKKSRRLNQSLQEGNLQAIPEVERTSFCEDPAMTATMVDEELPLKVIMEEFEHGELSELKESPKVEARQEGKKRVVNRKAPKKKRVRRSKHGCPKCGKMYRRPCELKVHLLSHMGVKPYQCTDCGQGFVSKIGAEVHSIKKHGKEDGFSTVEYKDEGTSGLGEENGNFVGEQGEMESVGEKEEDFEWKIDDGDGSENWKNLETQRMGLNGIGMDVNENSTLKKKGRKRKSVSQPRPRDHECEICGKCCRTPGELQAHLRMHTGERPFICEICGQAYRHQSALEVHVAMHKGEKPFKCEMCNKGFTQKGGLQRHLLMHTGEKPFQCDICGKTFTFHSSFDIHRLSHTGEKRHKCPDCGLALISTSHLKRHQRVHTGEKRFRCELCSKAFAERYNLDVHRRTHTGEKQHKCQICGRGFERKNKLQEHLTNHIEQGYRCGGYKIDLVSNSKCIAQSRGKSTNESSEIRAHRGANSIGWYQNQRVVDESETYILPESVSAAGDKVNPLRREMLSGE